MWLELANSEKRVLVDEPVYWAMRRYKWKVSKKGYVYRTDAGPGIVLMHREIMWEELERKKRVGKKERWVVDHWNGDKLDMRKGNLRVVRQGKNIMNNFVPRSDNRSGVVGVYWDEAVKRWKAVCGRDYLGSFRTREEAEAVRKREVEARGGRHSRRGVEVELDLGGL